MNTARNILSRTFLYLAGLVFFFTAVTFAFFSVVNPDPIKDALKEEDVYSNIVPAALETTANTNVSTAQIPLKEPWVRAAAEKAFPASDLEQKTTTVIDGTFAWLDGTTQKPEFSIDLSANKQAFAQEVGNYAQTRYETLPVCTRADVPANTSANLLTVSCRVPGISGEVASRSIVRSIQSDKDFLPNTVITPTNATLNPVGQSANTNIYDDLQGLRNFYQQKTLLQWLLPLITIVLIAGGLLLSQNRIRTTRQLMRTFIVLGAGLLILGFVAGTGLGKVIDTLALDAVTANIIEPVITNLGGYVQRTYFIFGGIAIVIAIASYAASRMLKNVQKAQQPSFERPPLDQNQPRG